MVNFSIINMTFAQVNRTFTRMVRPNISPIVGASLTSDGNLTLELEEGNTVPYNEKFSIEYTQHPAFASRWTRRIGDAFHNQVASFEPEDGDNQINPRLLVAEVMRTNASILNITFDGNITRFPNAADFNVTVDNITVPIASVYIEAPAGRIILTLEPTTVTQPSGRGRRSSSASNATVYDPMQPVTVSYRRYPLPAVNYSTNTTRDASLLDIAFLERRHIADNYNRAVSSFFQIPVQNDLADRTPPVFWYGEVRTRSQ